jgi:hypothetical protein
MVEVQIRDTWIQHTMPPKKVIVEEVLGPWALGRFSTNLKV